MGGPWKISRISKNQDVTWVVRFTRVIRVAKRQSEMGVSMMRSVGEAYSTGFLADSVVESLGLVERQAATASDLQKLAYAEQLVSDARAGYLALRGGEDWGSVTGHPTKPRSQLSRALGLAIQVWMAESWRGRYPEFTITRESIIGELEVYIASLRALHGGEPLQEIKGWEKTRDFFAGLVQVAIERAEAEWPGRDGAVCP